eukprot:TRINITY_DN2066_c1_g2_i1.p1 TRINITY_DN2066_c1_g2~~TRINITY_DN2066_c1_g2_i1.p1  ORF type:complete len:233 (+),score=-25.89 TRINITY_DN2066_c1_g2_i1:294-992(+)
MIVKSQILRINKLYDKKCQRNNIQYFIQYLVIIKNTSAFIYIIQLFYKILKNFGQPKFKHIENLQLQLFLFTYVKRSQIFSKMRFKQTVGHLIQRPACSCIYAKKFLHFQNFLNAKICYIVYVVLLQMIFYMVKINAKLYKNLDHILEQYFTGLKQTLNHTRTWIMYSKFLSQFTSILLGCIFSFNKSRIFSNFLVKTKMLKNSCILYCRFRILNFTPVNYEFISANIQQKT